MYKLIDFFIITISAYYILKPIKVTQNNYCQTDYIYKDNYCQTEITNNDIEYLINYKKDIDDINNGTYQWNII